MSRPILQNRNQIRLQQQTIRSENGFLIEADEFSTPIRELKLIAGVLLQPDGLLSSNISSAATSGVTSEVSSRQSSPEDSLRTLQRSIQQLQTRRKPVIHRPVAQHPTMYVTHNILKSVDVVVPCRRATRVTKKTSIPVSPTVDEPSRLIREMCLHGIDQLSEFMASQRAYIYTVAVNLDFLDALMSRNELVVNKQYLVQKLERLSESLG